MVNLPPREILDKDGQSWTKYPVFLVHKYDFFLKNWGILSATTAKNYCFKTLTKREDCPSLSYFFVTLQAIAII